MSGFNPFKAIGKVFKSVGKAIKKVWEAVKPIVKPLLIAAAIYFTAGTATAFFAAPSAGLGAAMSSTATSMWTGITSIFSGVPAMSSAATSTAATAGSTAATAGSTASALAPTVANASALGTGAQTAALVDGATTAASALPAAAATTAGNAAASTGLIGRIAGGIGTVIEKYPAAAMMLGQGVSGVAKARQEAETAEAERERQDSFGIWGASNTGQNFFAPRTTEENIALAKDPSKIGLVSQVAKAPSVQAQTAPQSQSQQYMTPQELQAARKQANIRYPTA